MEVHRDEIHAESCPKEKTSTLLALMELCPGVGSCLATSTHGEKEKEKYVVSFDGALPRRGELPSYKYATKEAK